METFNFILLFICILAFIIGYVVVSKFIKFLQKNRFDKETQETGSDENEWQYNKQDAKSSFKQPWYEILGVGPNASIEQIRNAYLQLIKQYHPDKLSNLAPELRNIAEKRTKEINQAYHEGLEKNY